MENNKWMKIRKIFWFQVKYNIFFQLIQTVYSWVVEGELYHLLTQASQVVQWDLLNQILIQIQLCALHPTHHLQVYIFFTECSIPKMSTYTGLFDELILKIYFKRKRFVEFERMKRSKVIFMLDIFKHFTVWKSSNWRWRAF